MTIDLYTDDIDQRKGPKPFFLGEPRPFMPKYGQKSKKFNFLQITWNLIGIGSNSV